MLAQTNMNVTATIQWLLFSNLNWANTGCAVYPRGVGEGPEVRVWVARLGTFVAICGLPRKLGC